MFYKKWIDMIKEKIAKKRQISIIIVSVILLTIIVVFFVINRKTTIDINKYIIFNEMGYEGYGEVSAYFDADSFYEDFLGIIRPRKNVDAKYFVENVIGGSVNNVGTYLKNGDKVIWRWNCDDDLARKQYRCVLNYSDIPYTMSDLKPCTEYDPFEDIDIHCEGVSPNGTAQIEIRNSKIPVKYSVNPSRNLSNGQQIKVNVELNQSGDIYEYCARNYGLLLTDTSKDYTIKGLDFYAKSVKELPAGFIDNILNDVDNAIRTNESTLPNGATMLGFEHIEYLLYKKKNGSSHPFNKLFVISKIDANVTDGDKSTDFEYYFMTYFDDIIVSPSSISGYRIGRNGYFNGNFSIDEDGNEFKDIFFGIVGRKGEYYFNNGYSKLSDAYAALKNEYEIDGKFVCVDDVVLN